MKLSITLLVFVFTYALQAQDRMLPADTMVKTNHTVSINGERIPYTAETGTQPIWNDDGKIIASLFYTYYTRDNITNRSSRPIVISFNGGPG